MEQKTHEEGDLRGYVLGLLPQERLRPLEERLLTDSAFYEELLIVEEELVEEYLAGGLAEHERAVFEARFANTPSGRREVRFAGALKAYVAVNTPAAAERPAEPSAKPPREAEAPAKGGGFFARLRGPVYGLPLAGAAILLVCAASWLAVTYLRPPSGPGQVLTVLLTPGGATRGGGNVQEVVVPSGTYELRLQLKVTADGFQHYSAALRRADGTAPLTAERLKPESAADGEPVVVVSVPSRDAPPGDYQLSLSGVSASGELESVSSYRFKVISR